MDTPARRPPLTSMANARPSVPRLPNAKPWSTLSAATASGCPPAKAKPLVEIPKATSASANCRFTRSARYATPTGRRETSWSTAMSDVRNPMSESAYPYPARYGGNAISIVPLVVVIAAVIASTAMNGRAMVGMVAHYVGVKTETVEFYSEGARLRGFLHRPDAAADRLPFIVQGPGWLGLADAKLYAPYHEAFTDAGFAVLIFDYRGFGESEGDRGTISPTWQLQDWRSAIAYLRSRRDIDAERGAIFGSGGTGGGNAVMVAAAEPDMRATISQVPVADGRDWLRRMRTSDVEWNDFLARVEADRRQRAATGSGVLVHPRDEIMIQTAERRASTVKADVDSRIPTAVPLSCANGILDYRPIDVARAARGVMIVAVEGDAVTPTD